jgi:hypothetical protein
MEIYSVGDKVRVLPLEEMRRAMGMHRRSRDGCAFALGMDVYCGAEAIIAFISRSGGDNPFAYRYILKINEKVIDHWCFTTDMLEPMIDLGEGLSIDFSFDDLLR